MELIACNECERPSGVLLDIAELPTDENRAVAQRFIEEALVEHLEEHVLDPFEIADIDGVPAVEVEEVIWVTEDVANFATVRLGCDRIGEGTAWYPIDQFDAPQWLLRGRKRRWAYRWDCCHLTLHRVDWALALREAAS